MGSPLWAQDEEAVNAIETYSVSYSSEVHLGMSVGKDMATIVWDQDGILLVDFLSPAIRSTVTVTPNSCGNWRVTSVTSGQTLTWTSPFIMTTREFIQLRPRVRNLRNWYGQGFLNPHPLYAALIGHHSTSTCSDHRRTSSAVSILQTTVNWIPQ